MKMPGYDVGRGESVDDDGRVGGERSGPGWGSRWLLLALLGVMLLRLAMLGWPALTDNTESRYGVIAMNMATSGDWVTPRLHFQGRAMPFWGKPPLLFWLTAASFRVFGISEWAARLPGYLAGLAMLGITFVFVRRFWSRDAAVASTLVLASSLLFFGLAGSVTIDIVLALASTAAMATFACFAAATDSGSRRRWGMAFALALALGMLSKGPIAVVLAGLSVAVWLSISRRWGLLASYPWGLGLVVFLGIAAPWFWLAERATPGFLRYFIVNEHILRYLQHEYGDLYGSGHTRPYGSAWPLLVAGFLPWTVVLIRAVASRVRRQETVGDPWFAYVLVWGLVPTVFFTFARQLIITYLLPGFAGLAVVAGVALAGRGGPGGRRSFGTLLRWQLVGMAVAVGVLSAYAVRAGSPGILIAAVALGAALLWFALRMDGRRLPRLVAVQAVAVAAFMFLAAAVSHPQVDDRYSARIILERVALDPGLRDRALVFPADEPDSASFYARLLLARDIEHHPAHGKPLLRSLVEGGSSSVLIMEQDDWSDLAPDLRSRLDPRVETANWVASVVRSR